MAFTQEEKEKIKQAGVGVGTAMTSTRPSLAERTNVSTPVVPIVQNFVGGFLGKGIQDIREAVSGEERQKRFKEIIDPYREGQKGLLPTAFQTGGEVIRGATEAAMATPGIKQAVGLFGKGIEKLSETKPIQSAGEALSPVTKQVMDWYESKSGEEKKNIDALVQYASVLPIGKATDVGVQAGLKSAEIGLKTASTVAAPIVKTAGEVVSSAGRVIKSTGKNIFEGSITPTVVEGERILAYKAKAPLLTRIVETVKGSESKVKSPQTRASTALEKGIFGGQEGIGIQSKRIADKTWSEIEPAVNQSKAIVSKNELFTPIEERISKTIEPSKRKAYEDAYEAIKEDYANIKEFSLKDAQNVKRSLDEFTPQKQFRGKDVANEYTVLKNDMANAIREKTYNALEDINIKQKYLDWANLHELQKVGVKAITEAGTRAGSGTLISTLWDMATIPIKTVGGQTLYRVGNLVEFIGDKGIKKFSDFLKQKGFVMPDIPNTQGGFVKNPFATNASEEIGQTSTKLQEKASLPDNIPQKVASNKNDFSSFHPDDQEFLTDFAYKVNNRKAVSLNDFKIAKETWEAEGYTVPKTKKEFADLILQAVESSFNKTIKI